MWSWNGSNTSEKISEQLEDNFFANTTIDALGIERGPTVDVQRWGDWIVTSNDYLFDTNTGGWWTLPEGSLGHFKHLWYQPSSDGDWLYAAFASPTASVSIDCYSRRPDHHLQLGELPDPPSERRQEPQHRHQRGRGASTRGRDGNREPHGAPGDDRRGPVAVCDLNLRDLSRPVPALHAARHRRLIAQDVQLEIQSSALSDGPAPIVYSVAIGYVETPAKVSSG